MVIDEPFSLGGNDTVTFRPRTGCKSERANSPSSSSTSTEDISSVPEASKEQESTPSAKISTQCSANPVID